MKTTLPPRKKAKTQNVPVIRKTLPSGQESFLDIEEETDPEELKKDFQQFVIENTKRGITTSIFTMLNIPHRTVDNWKYQHRMPAPWIMQMLLGRDWNPNNQKP